MIEENKPFSVDVFLVGKLVSLCQPNIEMDILNGSWHTWFNDKKLTEFLEHGNRPISASEEADIVRAEMSKPSSLILTIVSNANKEVIGVISIKDINHVHRRAEIALVTSGARLPGAALEAMALLTEHAFDRLNLQKLYAGQHEGLWKWVNSLALIGYKVEGLRRCQGFRNGESYDVILTGITAQDFYKIRAERMGDVLTGDVSALVRTRKKVNVVTELKRILAQANE